MGDFFNSLFHDVGSVAVGAGLGGTVVLLVRMTLKSTIAALRTKAILTPTKADDVALDVADKVVDLSTEAAGRSLKK